LAGSGLVFGGRIGRPDRRGLPVTPSSSSVKFGDPHDYRLAATTWSVLDQRATPPRDGRHRRGGLCKIGAGLRELDGFTMEKNGQIIAY